MNHIGSAPARGREVVPNHAAEKILGETFGEKVPLPDCARVLRGPSSCPACGAESVSWAYDESWQLRREDEFHPLLLDEIDRLAETFCCRSCLAGWIEPDDLTPITWVRPYWTEPA
jgi:hypothetical protein